MLGLFRSMSNVEGVSLGEPGGTPGIVHQSVGYPGPLPDEQPAVYVRLLGDLEVTGCGDVEPDRISLLNEALVFLTQHRDGVHPRVLAGAIWPRGVSADLAESTISRLTDWLGVDAHGQRNLVTEADGRLRLGRLVWTDWDLFLSLQSRALYDVSLQAPIHRDNLLAAALDLVRGPFLANREAGRYGWLAYEVAEAQIPALIADTALQLADIRLAANSAQAAIDAVTSGMRGSPEDEELWRGLLRATAATGVPERLEGVVEELCKRTWYTHGIKGLHPRTEALVDELLPDWRHLVDA
jgi:Bacterial transcriptional activator domain